MDAWRVEHGAKRIRAPLWLHSRRVRHSHKLARRRRPGHVGLPARTRLTKPSYELTGQSYSERITAAAIRWHGVEARRSRKSAANRRLSFARAHTTVGHMASGMDPARESRVQRLFVRVKHRSRLPSRADPARNLASPRHGTDGDMSTGVATSLRPPDMRPTSSRLIGALFSSLSCRGRT